jgi:heme oxygenase
MSILREYTNAKHREVEAHPFVQYLLGGTITKEHYGMYLQQMYFVYNYLEYYASISGLIWDLPDLRRAGYIEKDLGELYMWDSSVRFKSTEKYRDRFVTLNYDANNRHKLLAHVYVRHMGDLYGGKLIGRKVPGSGKAYQFDDRPFLIKTLDAKLTMDILDEALLAFDMSANMFDDMLKKVNETK